MRESCKHTRHSSTSSLTDIGRLFGILMIGLLLLAATARAHEADDEYLRIFNLIQQGDTSEAAGKAAIAVSKYQEARTALAKLQKEYPDFEPKMVSFRLNYLAEKILASSPKTPSTVAVPLTNPPGASAASTTNATQPQAQVKLLEAGAEPHKILRLHPKEGDKQALSIAMKTAVDMKMGDMQLPATKVPGMKLAMEATIKGISPEGDITYDMSMNEASVEDEPGVMPQVAQAMKASLAGVKGLSGTGTLSNRGINKGTDIKLPSNADPQMRQATEQMKESFARISVPLPEEAIGLGAKWEVKMPVKSQGMTLDQTATYELTSLEGERLTIKSIVSQSAANQKIENPGMPGLKLDLKKMVGSGNGVISFDLARLLPANGDVKFHSDMSMGTDAGGQAQSMDMKIDMTLTLESK